LEDESVEEYRTVWGSIGDHGGQVVPGTLRSSGCNISTHWSVSRDTLPTTNSSLIQSLSLLRPENNWKGFNAADTYGRLEHYAATNNTEI